MDSGLRLWSLETGFTLEIDQCIQMALGAVNKGASPSQDLCVVYIAYACTRRKILDTAEDGVV